MLKNSFPFLDQVMRIRRLPIVVFHLVLIAIANYLAFWLRFDGDIPPEELLLYRSMLPWLLLLQGATFIPFRLYEGLWRYSGIWDLRNIITGVVSGTALFYVLVHWVFGIASYPRSIFFVHPLLLIVLMGGARMARRLFSGFSGARGDVRVLIYGAGDDGEKLLRDIKNNPSSYNYAPIAFVDDDISKLGQRIHGVPIRGTRRDIPALLKKMHPTELLIAIPRIESAVMRELIEILRPFKLPIRIMAAANDPSGRSDSKITQIRDVSVEDLLDRPAVGLDLEPVKQFIMNKRVLVTGAGGSIGSELSRQIADYRPETLILLDKSEVALYTIDMEIRDKFPGVQRATFLMDIKNVAPLEQLFLQYSPDIVFHAAAYKHVPLMEAHPGEAILNNVTGTRRLCEMAMNHRVKTFISISTDKAVNPTNIMGASKRIGETLIQSLSRDGAGHSTTFAAVRFGNVLGSSGSVVPLFCEQIARGGPVTVTHPEMMRYFMTIPEAVQLVLRTATLARGGEIFVLDMGEQVKLVDMARNLIRIAGFVPDKEIPITFVGLRPGEKLREELVAMDETCDSVGVEKIMIIKSGWIPPFEFLTEQISKLEQLAMAGKSEAIIDILQVVVPTFRQIDPTTPPCLPEQEKAGAMKNSHANGRLNVML